MKDKSENIEERLVPYIEGVLNAREKNEVSEAVNADPDLAREFHELKDLIVDIREAFASGVKPLQEELTPEEVVELASFDGGLEGMPGTVEQKSRLFISDQALDEYRMLQALSEDMRRTTLDRENIPPMPAELQAEFGRLAPSQKSNVLDFRKKLSPVPLWKRASALLDRIDPKPLMATAAAFVMLSLGIHVYQQPTNSSVTASPGNELSYGYTEAAAKRAGEKQTTDTNEPQEKPAAGGKSAVSEPSGVAVFTSGDKDLLNEQAEKLMANKVRYTLTDDRILVSEKEVAQARDVLWGEDEMSGVAMAEDKPSSSLKAEAPNGMATGTSAPTEPRAGRAPKAPVKRERRFPQAQRQESAPSAPEAPIYKTYDYRTSQASKAGASKDQAPEFRSAVKPEPEPQRKGSTGVLNGYVQTESEVAESDRDSVDSALRAKNVPQASSAQVEDGEIVEEKPLAAPKAKDYQLESPEQRRQRLRDLALGKEKSEQEQAGSETASDMDAPDVVANRPEPSPVVKTRVNRARSLPAPAAEPVFSAPVANVITSDKIAQRGSQAEASPTEASGGAVARRPAKPVVIADEEAGDIANFKVNDEPVGQAVRGQSPGTNKKVLRESTVPSSPAPPAKPGSAVASGAERTKDIGSDPEDLRLARIRGAQPAVARRYNVVLSVESKGDKIRVYVRPKSELTKKELDALRKSIRRDLGLSDEDAIVFR